jgi:hypothetical protein
MPLKSMLHWQSATISDLVTFGISLALAYAITKAVYRLYFHPLAKYPGPFWARLSSFPSYWHTLQRDRHVWLLQLQEQYGQSSCATNPWLLCAVYVSRHTNSLTVQSGSTFRYRPDSVLVNTPTAYRTLFGPKGNVKKGLFYEVWPRTVDALTTWNSVNIDGKSF